MPYRSFTPLRAALSLASGLLLFGLVGCQKSGTTPAVSAVPAVATPQVTIPFKIV